MEFGREEKYEDVHHLPCMSLFIVHFSLFGIGIQESNFEMPSPSSKSSFPSPAASPLNIN